ncbi:MAG: glycosyltransferase [Terracidiphilus sp.]
MRIAYMLTSLGMGGAERHVVALAEHMAAHGHSVLLIVLRERQLEEWPTALEVVYLDLRKTPGSLLAGVIRALALLRTFRPELVHSHTCPANLMARLLRGMGGPQVVSTIHNVFEGGRLRMLAYRFTDSLALRTTAVSEEAALRFIEMKAVSPCKCTVLTNAIDVKEFSPQPARRASMRNELGAGDAFIWLAVGRVVSAKGFLNLLQAFAKVWPVFPRTQLWIAGPGQPASRKRTHYSAIPVAKGTMERVRRLGLERDMPALYDAADAFALASAWEGMPLVLGEAMAMEKPIVATNVGGVHELLGACGELVPPGNPEPLAQAMLQVMRQSTETRASVGRAARMRIVNHFDIATRFSEWEAFYRGLLA